MNHHWADLYAKQRFTDLSADVRGDQLLRMAKLESENASTEPEPSTISRLRVRLIALAGRAVHPLARPSGR